MDHPSFSRNSVDERRHFLAAHRVVLRRKRHPRVVARQATRRATAPRAGTKTEGRPHGRTCARWSLGAGGQPGACTGGMGGRPRAPGRAAPTATPCPTRHPSHGPVSTWARTWATAFRTSTGRRRASTAATAATGPVAGGQIGYNIQTGRIVYGVEADISSSFIDGGNACCGHTVNWLASVRGRLGLTGFDNRTLFYVTAGAAWADIEYSSLGNFSDTHFGWVAGGGIERALTPNLSARVEYLYYDFDSVTAPAGTAGPGLRQSRAHACRPSASGSTTSSDDASASQRQRLRPGPWSGRSCFAGQPAGSYKQPLKVVPHLT